jgi:hypothetical protein
MFTNQTYTQHNLYHPYSFIGIPGLPPGHGFEKLRSNQGFYLTTANQPFAEMVVRLRWNRLTQMYNFDQHQYNPANHFIDDFDAIFNAPDISLRAVWPKIYQAEVPAYYNFRTNIYLPALDKVFFSNT